MSRKTVKEGIKSTKVLPAVKAAADDAKLSQKQRLAIARLPEDKQIAAVAKQAAVNIVAARAEQAAAAKLVSDVAEPGIEDEKEEGIEDRIDADVPENYRTAFLLRADQAVRFASYSGPKKYKKELAEQARLVVAAWTKLAEQLERMN